MDYPRLAVVSWFTACFAGSLLAQTPIPVFELSPPYAAGFTHLALERGLGNGTSDLNADGQREELTRGWVLVTPASPEYFGTANGTKAPGPQVRVRGVVGVFPPAGDSAPFYGAYGFTRDGLRMIPLNPDKGGVTTSMGFIEYVLFHSASFTNGGQPVALRPSTLLRARFSNPVRATYRFMIVAGGKAFVSADSSTAAMLELNQAGLAEWLPYRHFESNRDIRFREDPAAGRLGGVALGPIEAVGLYRELMPFDGITTPPMELDANLTGFTFAP